MPCAPPRGPWPLHSCLASDPGGSEDGRSLQHNKFMTFSRLADGRGHVVFETSMNFFGASQMTYFNDAVEIAGDETLHAGYERGVSDMMEQGPKRTNDRYAAHVTAGDDGRNVMYPSPRWQPDLRTHDIIAERMAEIDCTEGGVIRAANQAFRTERAVIVDQLARLSREGCDVEVVVTSTDADIVAPLVAAGVRVTPFQWRAQGTSLPQVRVHNKFWLVDARRAGTGDPLKIAYAGSSNWRADQQYSDDLLLGVDDAAVHAAYLDHWNVIRQRASSDMALVGAADDERDPVSVAVAPPEPQSGWHRDAVRLRLVATDGHVPNATSGLSHLHVELSGAQVSTTDLEPQDPRIALEEELVISAQGETTVTYHAVDRAGNAEEPRSVTIRIDGAPPLVQMTGQLAQGCSLWPPNGLLVPVGGVSAEDPDSGIVRLDVEATSEDAATDGTRVEVRGSEAAVSLRAEKSSRAQPRTYVVVATATDAAGNAAFASGTCVVPHSQGSAG